MVNEDEEVLKQRWQLKRDSIYNLRDKVDRLKRKVRSDLYSSDDKTSSRILVISQALCPVIPVSNDTMKQRSSSLKNRLISSE